MFLIVKQGGVCLAVVFLVLVAASIPASHAQSAAHLSAQKVTKSEISRIRLHGPAETMDMQSIGGTTTYGGTTRWKYSSSSSKSSLENAMYSVLFGLALLIGIPVVMWTIEKVYLNLSYDN